MTNGNEVYAPKRSKQTELGVKVDMGTYGASLGVYRIEQPSDGYCEINSATTCTYVREGEQINKGVEMNVFGEPIDGLRLISGLTLMDTELKNTLNGANDGNHAIGVPTFQFNAGVDWDVPGLQGVALNARMLRTGGQYADAANNLSLPTWNRFDAGRALCVQGVGEGRDRAVRRRERGEQEVLGIGSGRLPDPGRTTGGEVVGDDRLLSVIAS